MGGGEVRKQAKSVFEMIELLKQRGLTIDVPDMPGILLDNNYYRLSAYFRPFQKDPANGDNDFRPGAKVSDFLTPFMLDDQFRRLILEGTSRLELTLRARLAYNLALNGDAYNYDEPDSYRDIAYPNSMLKRDSLISNIKGWVSRSHEVCIRHYRHQHEQPPVWAVVEVLPFDTLSKMLQLHLDMDAVAKTVLSLGLCKNRRRASEIVHAMVYLRNLCSHHSRLWNREMVITPAVLKDMRAAFPEFAYEDKSVGNSLIVLMYLVDRINGDREYSHRILDFLAQDDSYRHGILHPLHWD